MPPPPRVPSRLPHGPFRGSAAVHAGLLSKRQLTGDHWRRLYPDAYLHDAALLDHFAWCRAAALILPPGAAIAGRSAAHALYADVLPLGTPPVEIAVPIGKSLRPHPMLAISRTILDGGDIERLGPLPVTTTVRTAIDLARRPGLTEAVVAVDALLNATGLTLPEVGHYAARRPGWPGSRQLDRVLTLAMPGGESPMETRLRLILVLGGLPTPVTQLEIENMRLDLAYPYAKVGVEYDGAHHHERGQFQRDLARLNRLKLLGWTILRFVAGDVLRHPELVITQVRAALSPHLLRL